MPDPKSLRSGDKIRLNAVPECDLRQREAELRTKNVDEPGWTADTIERIIQQNPIVTIDRIDEYGQPWFDYDLIRDDGSIEQHSMAIIDSASWDYVEQIT